MAHLSMKKDKNTCSRGNCTRPRYKTYPLCLKCGLGQKRHWALHVKETGSAATCRVPDCSGMPSGQSKYCSGCLTAAGPVLCAQYTDYIKAKGRGKYAEQDFQPHDLCILPDYVLVKTAKCIGEHCLYCHLAPNDALSITAGFEVSRSGNAACTGSSTPLLAPWLAGL